MSLRLHPHALLPGVIPPCLPTAAKEAPSGDGWLHEIKHDGYRVLARKDGQRITLFSRSGNEFTNRFPLIVEAMAQATPVSLTVRPWRAVLTGLPVLN
jgi:bifunctional non-homologous end joining protein LigD